MMYAVPSGEHRFAGGLLVDPELSVRSVAVSTTRQLSSTRLNDLSRWDAWVRSTEALASSR